MNDWTAFDRVLTERRRTIVEGFIEFVRLESVSQEPEKVRVTGEWLAETLRARTLDGRVLETRDGGDSWSELRLDGDRPAGLSALAWSGA